MHLPKAGTEPKTLKANKVCPKCYIASSPTVPWPTGCTGRMAGPSGLNHR